MNRIMGLCDNIIGTTLTLIILTIWIFGSGATCDESDTMSRSTRPKALGSNDLSKFLDVVRDYYTVNSKARYGKRGVIPAIIVHDRPHTRLIIDSLMKTLETVKDKHREREKFLKKEKTAGNGHKRNHDNRVKQENKKKLNIRNQIHMRVLFKSVLRRWLYN